MVNDPVLREYSCGQQHKCQYADQAHQSMGAHAEHRFAVAGCDAGIFAV
jgi:hypothetical protein